jgi:hypothetical protein
MLWNANADCAGEALFVLGVHVRILLFVCHVLLVVLALHQDGVPDRNIVGC